MPDLIFRQKIRIAGNPMPNALDWGIIVAGHHPGGVQAICIDPEFLPIDPQQPHQHIGVRFRKVANGMNAVTAKFLRRGPPDIKEIGSR